MTTEKTVRCEWDNQVRALYVHFDGSKVGDPPRPMNVYQFDASGDASIIVDVATEDDDVKGVEVLAPVIPGDDGPLNPWHWFMIGAAWQEAQMFAAQHPKVLTRDWLLSVEASQ